MSFIGRVIATGRLADALRGRAGGGKIVSLDDRFQVRESQVGTLVSLKIPDWAVRAQVVAHTGSPNTPAPPSTITYTIRMLEGPLSTLSGLTPRWRRVRNDEVDVYPAEPESPCWMYRFPSATSPTGEAWYLDLEEATHYADCEVVL